MNVLCAICGSGLYCHLHDENRPTVEQLEARQAQVRWQIAEWERAIAGRPEVVDADE